MHGPIHTVLDAGQRTREGQQVTLWGAVIGLGLATVQITTGILGRSQAMVADGIHSISDLVTDVAVWFGLRFSSAPPDADHPWGHGKIETLVSVLVGASLVFVGFGIGADALVRIRDGVDTTPGAWPLLAAVLAIVSKEFVYRWTMRVGRRIRNPALIANAWHHRSDAFSSIAALVGIAGARLGVPWMDPLAAAVVGVFIVRVGGKVLWRSFQDLLDRQAAPETVALVQAILDADPAVIDAHRLRLRAVGGVIVGDVHVVVDGEITVREGHAIVERLERATHTQVPGLGDLVIHVDPHPDPDTAPAS